jgi:hypothetical protein
VLPKYSTFVQQLLASIMANKHAEIANKHAEALKDNRNLLQHEMGQVSAGIKSLNGEFRRYLNRECSRLLSPFKNNERYYSQIDSFYKELLHKADLYSGDMEGQFYIVDMMSRVYDDPIKVVPKYFFIYRQFINKWRLIFTSQCREKNNGFCLPRSTGHDRMHTDPGLLEHAVYNLVNNAIKYSYVNTNINVGITKSEDGQRFIITVTNYGSFLNVHESRIFEKGYREEPNTGIHNLDEDTDGIGIRNVTGAGMGLYWTKKIANAIECDITPFCEEISKYNVSLMKPFFERYTTKESVQKKRELLISVGIDLVMPPYDDIKAEYDRLLEKGKYDVIVNSWEDRRLMQISHHRLFDEITVPTYEVSFTLEVPKFYTRRSNDEKGNIF